MSMSGAQYIHYAFGLMDRTGSFCPVQAVIDNEHIGKIKHCLREPKLSDTDVADALQTVKKVMASSSRLYTRHVRKAIRSGVVSEPYRFESNHEKKDRVLEKELEALNDLEMKPARHLDRSMVDRIYNEVPGILPGLKQHS